jgi:predicted pyridoxine 5'-phosphate oxidase superfamily flavin-nucleotide-binding protein
MYHDGNRTLQDRFDSRRIADRLVEVLHRVAFTAEDREFIESRAMFFLATAGADGWPDCSYKGGRPGFVRVIADDVLAFPSYDGNGMFKSLGNVLVNPKVGLLFMDFEKPKRLRVNGTATIDRADPLLGSFPGAQLVVRVKARHIFPNCPRYIHRMRLEELSVYAPAPGHTPPVPAWKEMDAFRDYLPRADAGLEGRDP